MLVTRCLRQARSATGSSFTNICKSQPSTSTSNAEIAQLSRPSQSLCESLSTEKLRHLQIIQQEYELLRNVCMYIPNTLTDEQYRVLMSISCRNTRANYLQTLYAAECRRNVVGNDALLRTKLKTLMTTIEPAIGTPRLVFDCRRMVDLSDDNLHQIYQLITDSLIAVLSHKKPWRVTLANCHSSDLVRQRLFGDDAMDICSLAVDIIEQSFVDIAPEEDAGVVTYLTTSKRFEYLTEVRSSDVYVLDVLDGSNFTDRHNANRSASDPEAIDGLQIRRIPLPLHADMMAYSATAVPLWQSASFLLDAHLTNNCQITLSES